MNLTTVTFTIQKDIWWSTEKTRDSQIKCLEKGLEKQGYKVDRTNEEDIKQESEP